MEVSIDGEQQFGVKLLVRLHDSANFVKLSYITDVLVSFLGQQGIEAAVGSLHHLLFIYEL
jgi:hypothetical protein